MDCPLGLGKCVIHLSRTNVLCKWLDIVVKIKIMCMFLKCGWASLALFDLHIYIAAHTRTK